MKACWKKSLQQIRSRSGKSWPPQRRRYLFGRGSWVLRGVDRATDHQPGGSGIDGLFRGECPFLVIPFTARRTNAGRYQLHLLGNDLAQRGDLQRRADQTAQASLGCERRQSFDLVPDVWIHADFRELVAVETCQNG